MARSDAIRARVLTTPGGAAMIRPPLLETQLTPAAWAYQVGFVQETRR